MSDNTHPTDDDEQDERIRSLGRRCADLERHCDHLGGRVHALATLIARIIGASEDELAAMIGDP